MPKATAVWLLDNTALTFQQIADFCKLHFLEVETLANQEVSTIIGLDPIINGQLTQEEIDRCTGDKNARLQLQKNLSVGLSNKKVSTHLSLAGRINQMQLLGSSNIIQLCVMATL